MAATRDGKECVPAFLCVGPAPPSERIARGRLARFSLGELQALVHLFHVEPSRAWVRESLEAQREFFEATVHEVGRFDPASAGAAAHPER